MAGIVPGDHVCATFGSDDEHRAIVARYARQALRRGERFLYLTYHSDEATIRGYLADAGIEVRPARTLAPIEIRPADHAGDRLDPEAIIAALQADRRAALGGGYSALCVASEMAWTLARPADIDALAYYEREVNRVFAAADIAGLCQYDRRLLGPDVLERLVPRHEFQICIAPHLTTAARRRLTVSEHEDGAIALSGALDIDSSGYLAARLAELEGDGDLVVLTSGLGFADVAGCRALVRAAEVLPAERRILLPDPSAPLVRVLSLCGWSTSARLVLA